MITTLSGSGAMRFIGCKANLLDFIKDFVDAKDIKGQIFCDLFAGTGSVAKHFKRLGYKIISADLLYFSYVMQKTYIEMNEYPAFTKAIKHLNLQPTKDDLLKSKKDNANAVIAYLNDISGAEGFIYNNYCPEGTRGKTYSRKYFTGENAKKIDAIRGTIEKWKNDSIINEKEFYFLLTALIEAVPYVANISGTYSAFLKTYDKRAFKQLTLEVPEIIESAHSHKVYMGDGVQLLDEIKKVDILYLDPPYNERQYAPNYHILETIARWDNPVIKGITGMRPYENQKSKFCNSSAGLKDLEKIVKSKKFKHLLLSYNDEGIICKDRIAELLENYGKLQTKEQSYQRYKSNSNGINRKNVVEKIYHLKAINEKNKLNDLSGSEWTYFLNSVEVTNYSTKGKDSFAHHLRKQHPSPKPPQLMKKFVDFFTKENEIVLDPFMGVGGTLMACSLSNRKGIGIDLSERYIEVYKQACEELNIKEQKTFVGNSLEIDKILPKKSQVDFILTDPPYGDMLSKKQTGDKRKRNGGLISTPFTDEITDLGNMDAEMFFESLKDILQKAIAYLKPKGYLAVFVKDMQPTGKQHNMLHFSITEKLLEIPELSFRGYKIWYDTTQMLYPFGYPHAFVSNQFHQFVMIFRKENE